MKKYLFMLFVLAASISVVAAQAQKQIAFSFEQGWDAAEFDLSQTFQIQLKGTSEAVSAKQFAKLKKMEDKLVRISLDEKTNKVSLYLALEKKPDWTSKEWFAYLQRRSILVR